MSITANARPAPEPTPGKYRCQRCGIFKARDSKGRNDFCDDCRDDAAAMGWAPPRKTWSRTKKTTTEGAPCKKS